MKKKQIVLCAGVILGLGILFLRFWMFTPISCAGSRFGPVVPRNLDSQLSVDQNLGKRLSDTAEYVDLGAYTKDGTWSLDPKKSSRILCRLATNEVITIRAEPSITSEQAGAIDTSSSYLEALTARLKSRIGQSASATITDTYPMEDTEEHFRSVRLLAPDHIRGQSTNWVDYDCTVHRVRRWTVSTYQTKPSNVGGDASLVKITHNEVVQPEYFYVLKSTAPRFNPGGAP